jgi:alpha-beta hydrolase superfamily lysophospholipase
MIGGAPRPKVPGARKTAAGGNGTMATISARDGTELYYKDWGSGPPVVLSHGWPLNADMWEYQMNFLAERGLRCVAHDRRGFGRSGQPWTGYDYDTFADDLATLIEKLDLRDNDPRGLLHGRRRGRPLRRPARHRARRQGRARGRGDAVHAQDRGQPERR